MGKIKLDGDVWVPYWTVEEWGGQDSELTDTFNLMEMPITYVRITYDDLLTKYDTTEHIPAVQRCQKDHIAEGLEDIRYNFLVTSEGHVYEGRGWYMESRGMPEKYSDLNHKLLTIAHIGDYSSKDPPWPALRSSMQVIMYGLKNRWIDASFKLIPLRDPVT